MSNCDEQTGESNVRNWKHFVIKQIYKRFAEYWYADIKKRYLKFMGLLSDSQCYSNKNLVKTRQNKIYKCWNQHIFKSQIYRALKIALRKTWVWLLGL